MQPHQTGRLDFPVPNAGKLCQTAYSVFGDLSSPQPPLVVLSGGPGVPHDYLLPLAQLAREHDVPVVFYDALGCGRSTHLPEKAGDASFWTVELFLRELDNILVNLGIQGRYSLAGQSWGGSLAAAHAVEQPRGLQKLVLLSAPADMLSWATANAKLRAELPVKVQQTLISAADNGTTDSVEALAAARVYWEKHLCRVNPMPEDVAATIRGWKEDMSVYSTMNGSSEFFVTGSLKGWTIVEQLSNINVATLLVNGRYDEAQDEVIRPFFEQVPRVRWVRFAESSHMPQWEEPQEFLRVLAEFLCE